MPDPKYTGAGSGNIASRGKFVVVDARALPEYTAAGAHLVQVLEAQEVWAGREAFCPRCLDSGGNVRRVSRQGDFHCYSCNANFVMASSAPVVVQAQRFLVQIEIDQVYAGLQRSLNVVEKQLGVADRIEREKTKQLEEARTLVKVLEADNDAASDKIEELQKQLAQAQEAYRRLEASIKA
jgi:hypothetical protein